MRVRSNSVAGQNNKPINSNGGALTIPLILFSGTPTNPLEAVSKQYADSKVDNLDASDIVGVFPAGRLPPLAGTEVSSPGGGVLTLSDTGVIAGTYSKVTVNAAGRITGGASLSTSDIPNFSFNKLAGLPTTLSGYGITDVMSITGGIFTGSLFVTQTPTLVDQVANRQYVLDRIAAVSGGGGDFVYKVGDIVAKAAVNTYPGYLRCNGGTVSQTTYAALYAAIGTIHGPAVSGNFTLPDLTLDEGPAHYWYIKV